MKKEKNLYTYVDNICKEDTYKGLRIIISRTAMQELIKHNSTTQEIIEILEKGYAPRKRSKEKIEKWLDKGNKTYNAVIAKNYDEINKKECWVLIHFGKFTKRKK